MEEVIVYLSSFFRVLAGFLIAVCLGVPAGLLRSRLPAKIKRNAILKFVFDSGRFWPPIALIPASIIYLGLGEMQVCSILVFGAFWPIMAITYISAEEVPQSIRDFGHSLELGRLRYLCQIILPAALLGIFKAIEAGLGFACIALIAAEMIGGHSGLGDSIQIKSHNLKHGAMWFDIFLTGTIGCSILLLIQAVKNVVAPWQEKYTLGGRP